MQSAQKCELGVSALFLCIFIGGKRDEYFDGVVIFAEVQTIRSNYKMYRLSVKCKDEI